MKLDLFSSAGHAVDLICSLRDYPAFAYRNFGNNHLSCIRIENSDRSQRIDCRYKTFVDRKGAHGGRNVSAISRHVDTRLRNAYLTEGIFHIHAGHVRSANNSPLARERIVSAQARHLAALMASYTPR